MLDILFLLLFLETNKPNDTFVMPTPVTYAEEKNVLVAVPVVPVEIEILN
tara:strand:+ start:1682 stop:1831 length:150 start_codon:yes stop_codon:yes gene_type:complete